MGVKQEDSVAGRVRAWVRGLPERSYFDTGDIPGSPRAVESALSRLAASGELARVRRGTYWKPPPEKFGRRARPAPLQAALHVAGKGAGPAGVSAARVFGLTTQVPAVEHVGVAGRAPVSMPGVRFSSRPYSRREHGLNSHEVALLEVLRSFDLVSERPWSDLVDAVKDAVADRRIRVARIAAAVDDERDRAARSRWQELADALDLQVAS